MTQYKVVEAQVDKIGAIISAEGRNGWKPIQLATAVIPTPPPSTQHIVLVIAVLEHT